MTDVIISGKLAERLNEIAEQELRSPEEMLTAMMAQYKVSESAPLAQSKLADADIDVPADIQDPAAYRATVRQTRPKLYQIVRRYWQSVGDQERLALTDDQLDQQFWLIDADGIPRLKSEQGQIALSPDPLEALVGLVDEAPIDLSASVRETMAAHYQDKSNHDHSA